MIYITFAQDNLTEENEVREGTLGSSEAKFHMLSIGSERLLTRLIYNATPSIWCFERAGRITPDTQRIRLHL